MLSKWFATEWQFLIYEAMSKWQLDIKFNIYIFLESEYKLVSLCVSLFSTSLLRNNIKLGLVF